MKNDKDDKDERKRGFKQNPMGIITDRIIEKGFAIVKSNYVEHFVTKQHFSPFPQDFEAGLDFPKHGRVSSFVWVRF